MARGVFLDTCAFMFSVTDREDEGTAVVRNVVITYLRHDVTSKRFELDGRLRLSDISV
jgi:hypothetical protein